MSLYIASLNSGSNGNCYYIGNGTDAVFIDAGLSCRETEKRMKQLGLLMHTVKAIFISHEHGDHIKGIYKLATKYFLPVYITNATASQVLHLPKHLAKPFSADVPINIGNLVITPFTKHHDAVDPYSFIITSNNTTVGVFTDIGHVCQNLIYYFKQCHAAFLEANYDEDLLDNGNYPFYLKNRIKGGKGHISNKQALALFTNHRPPFMTHLLLSHLSKENNSFEIVKELFTKHSNNTEIIIASRFEPTAVFTIGDIILTTPKNAVQLALFE